MCPLPLETLSHLPPHPTPLSCQKAPDLSSLSHAANSHWLPILPTATFMCHCYSQFVPSSPSLNWVHTSVLYVCISIAALQIVSSGNNIWYLLFLLWLTSLCIICHSFINLIEKQMFDKQMFAGPCRDNGTQSGLWYLGLPKFPPSHLAHILFFFNNCIVDLKYYSSPRCTTY